QRTGHARDARDARRDCGTADFCERGYVDVAAFVCIGDGFVARLLSPACELAACGDEQWVKPEQRACDHFEKTGGVVASRDVRAFVREDRFELAVFERVRARGQYEHRP